MTSSPVPLYPLSERRYLNSYPFPFPLLSPLKEAFSKELPCRRDGERAGVSCRNIAKELTPGAPFSPAHCCHDPRGIVRACSVTIMKSRDNGNLLFFSVFIYTVFLLCVFFFFLYLCFGSDTQVWGR